MQFFQDKQIEKQSINPKQANVKSPHTERIGARGLDAPAPLALERRALLGVVSLLLRNHRLVGRALRLHLRLHLRANRLDVLARELLLLLLRELLLVLLMFLVLLLMLLCEFLLVVCL